MNSKTRSLLNEQIAKELESGYLYLDLAAKCEARGLKGFSHWYRKQAEEEKNHAMIVFNYLLNEGMEVALGDLRMPKHSCVQPEEILKEALAHEKYVTELINDIYFTAQEDDDYRTMRFLDWFIDEQAEEERNARENIELLAIAGKCGCGLLELDGRMGERK